MPFLVLPIVFALLALLHRHKGLAERYSLFDAAAWSLAALLLVTGGAHFSPLRDDLIRMVPPFFPRPDLLVLLTGVFELGAAAALVTRRPRVWVGIALALMFVAMFPANIYAAQHALSIGGKPATPLWLRLPEQLVYIAFALVPVFERWTMRARPSGQCNQQALS